MINESALLIIAIVFILVTLSESSIIIAKVILSTYLAGRAIVRLSELKPIKPL